MYCIVCRAKFFLCILFIRFFSMFTIVLFVIKETKISLCSKFKEQFGKVPFINVTGNFNFNTNRINKVRHLCLTIFGS